MNYEAAYGHILVLFCVLFVGGLLLSAHVTILGLSLWIAALLVAAFTPLIWSIARGWFL